MNRAGWVVRVVAVLALSTAVQARTWTNTEGQTLEADLVRVKGDTVYLELAANGQIRPLKISLLSEADQEFIRQYERDQLDKQKAEALAGRKARWQDDYEDAQAEAEEFGLPILLLYTAPEWCGYCVRLEENILSQKAFQEYANANLVLFIADFSEAGDAEDWKEEYPKLIADFPCGGYPCAYLMTRDGKKLGRISGYDSEWSIQDYIDKLEKQKTKAK